MPDASAYLNQTVTVRRVSPPAPGDFYGSPVIGIPETLPARKTTKQQRRLSAGGTEVLTSTEVWLLGEIAIGDTVDGEPVQDRENVVVKDGEVLFWKVFM